MRVFAVAAASAALCAMVVAGPRPAAADVLVNVSKASQRISVQVDGTTRYNWLVSTGTKRYTTPSGVYKPEWLARKWKSKQYNNAPMPHSIFFHGGYAIHGTTEVSRLGRIASHGCVRLNPDNAAKLYSLVAKNMGTTRIVVSDDVIEKPGEAPKKKIDHFVADNAAGEAPAAGSKKIALEALALAPEDTSALENQPAAEKTVAHEAAAKTVVREAVEKITTRESAKPRRPERAEVARGFHW